MRGIISAAVLASAATPATAQDLNGFQAISTGDLTRAEQELTVQRRDFPARPELMLNLAHVFAKTDRQDQARVLYREVLARRDVAMDLADGTVVRSHVLAELGLTRLGGTTLAVR